MVDRPYAMLTWVSVGMTTIWLGPMRYGPSAPDTSQFGK